jgi:NADH-quinone oxidoreductase subunit H
MGLVLNQLGLEGQNHEWARVAFEALSFTLKVAFFMWTYVWVRWTLPRFRYDQVMDLGWKVMLPASLVNLFITALMIAMGWI